MEQPRKIPLFYDITPFNTFTLENEADQKKNQFVMYMIDKMKHIPLVSFCYEDVCDVLPDLAMQKSEIYISDIYVRRDGINVFIFLGHKGNGVSDITLMLEKTETGFKLVAIDADESRRPDIVRAVFNNYEYIEKTIIDQVSEHEDQISQLVSQVRKISKYLSSEQ